jgi:plastocyanin
MRAFIIGLILFSLVLSGCLTSQEEQNITNQTAPPPPPPPKMPTISISAPADGDVVLIPGDSGDVTLVMITQNLILRSPSGTADIGEGYLKVTVDGGSSQTVTTKNYLMTGLALGEHTVEVQLMNNDRTPYVPAIKKTAVFTVEKEKPAVYEPQTYTISVKDFAYEPSSQSVKVGDSITFVNSGAYPRSATCFIGGKEVFDTKVLGPGQSATITVHEVMDCEYYSVTHRAMTGTLRVESNGTG